MSETAASLGTTYSITVRVPQLVPPSPNATRREHHMARHRRVKRERADVALILAPFAKPPAGKIHVTLVRCSVGELDGHDNLAASMKGPIDEVAKWLGLDDADEAIVWKVEQKKVTRKDQGTVIRVEAWRAEARRG
jgi:hypothetical protein